MKKIISIFLTIIFLLSFSTSAFASKTLSEEAPAPSVIIAVNEETAIVNGNAQKITAPVLALDRTYVDLCGVAPLLGLEVKWVEAYIGYFDVSTSEKIQDFTLISKWDELKNQKYKFFVKDSKIFVSVRELCDFAGYALSYDDGIITIGNKAVFDKKIFGTIDTQSVIDDYVYKTYPKDAKYVVNPYQKYNYETMMTDIKKLEEMYPDIIKTSSIGKSVEGRDLLLVEFGRGDNKIFVCATHHAREYISTTYVMYAMDRYSYAYRNGTMWSKYNPQEILDNITFCIVPMVNPDGVNLVQNGLNATQNPEKIAAMEISESPKYGYQAWKANVRGVDLNWNYDKDWSEEKNKSPRGSSGFNGDQPATEPETVAVSNYVDSNVFEAYISFHTQGEIFYWAEDWDNPTYINEAIKKDTGFVQYTEKAEGIGGSFFDYVYRKYNKPTITVELCPYVGNYPYPDAKFDTIWKPAKNVMLIIGNEILYNLSKNK